jgi:hypothetical protein
MRGYKVSIGGSFFAGGGGSGHTSRDNEHGRQQINPVTDDNLQPPPEAPKMPPSQQRPRHPKMLSNLEMYNAPGIKDKGQVSGKCYQRNRHKNARQRETGSHTLTCNIGKTGTNDGNNQSRDGSRTKKTTYNKIAMPTTSQTTSPRTSPESSPAQSPIKSPEASTTPARKFSRRDRVGGNLRDISAHMQHTGQALT